MSMTWAQKRKLQDLWGAGVQVKRIAAELDISTHHVDHLRRQLDLPRRVNREMPRINAQHVVNVDAETDRQLRAAACEEGVSLQVWLRRAIANELARKERTR